MPVSAHDSLVLMTSYLERIYELLEQFCEGMRKEWLCWKGCPFGRDGRCLAHEDGPLALFDNIQLLNKGLTELSRKEQKRK